LLEAATGLLDFLLAREKDEDVPGRLPLVDPQRRLHAASR